MLASRLLAGSAAGAATLAFYQSQKPSAPKVVLGAKQRSAVVSRAACLPARRRRGGKLTRAARPPLVSLPRTQAMSSVPFGNPAHDWDYYGKCMIGGILSCGLTHLAVTPLDVVKCRMQVRPRCEYFIALLL